MAKKKDIEKQATEIVAKMFGVKEKTITLKQNEVTVMLPDRLRLGQAIVNALAYKVRKNDSINEDPMSVLNYISNEDLLNAVEDAHRPYYYSRA